MWDASADGTIIRGADLVDGHEEPAPEVMDCGKRLHPPLSHSGGPGPQGGGTFTGHGRLMERPQEPYFALFRRRASSMSRRTGRWTVRGSLTPGRYVLPGNASSQFVTGLLYALPLLEGDSEIVLTTDLESRGDGGG